MPTIRSVDSGVAAGGVVNPLVGSQYEYLPFYALVEVAILADAGDAWDASVFSGSDVLMQNDRVDQLATATPISKADHVTVQDVAAAGERLGVTLVNQTGAAADVRTVVWITPL